jgi:hypothetical protein
MYYHNTQLNMKKSGQILEWCVLGLAMCGVLIGLLALLAALRPELGRHYVDPWVHWSSRLLWQSEY